MQTLNAQIQIPSDLVLITKVEYEELLKKETLGQFISLKKLCEHIGASPNYVKENILLNPRFKKEMQEMVHFPTSQGDKWFIHRDKMFKFLDQQSVKVFLKRKY